MLSKSYCQGVVEAFGVADAIGVADARGLPLGAGVAEAFGVADAVVFDLGPVITRIDIFPVRPDVGDTVPKLADNDCATSVTTDIGTSDEYSSVVLVAF